MFSDFVLRKSCCLNPCFTVSLLCVNQSLRLEVRDSSNVITYMQFPYTHSGLTFAKRVYNAFV